MDTFAHAYVQVFGDHPPSPEHPGHYHHHHQFLEQATISNLDDDSENVDARGKSGCILDGFAIWNASVLVDHLPCSNLHLVLCYRRDLDGLLLPLVRLQMVALAWSQEAREGGHRHFQAT